MPRSQIAGLHAGEHRDSDQQRRIFAKRQQRFARGGHHSRAAGSMDIHHPYAQLSRCGHRAGGGVGNIVKLKVQNTSNPR